MLVLPLFYPDQLSLLVLEYAWNELILVNHSVAKTKPIEILLLLNPVWRPTSIVVMIYWTLNASKMPLDQSFGNLSGSQTCVITIDESKCTMPKIKITNITKFHSVAFDENNITFWQYYNIGSGRSKVLSRSDVILKFSIQQPFSNTQYVLREFRSNNSSSTPIYFLCWKPFVLRVLIMKMIWSSMSKVQFIFIFDDHSLSTNDRARHVFIEHLRGERLVDKVRNENSCEIIEFCY